MSTVYDAEAAINQAIADRARIPWLIDAAMKAHSVAPTAQGALSLARAISGFILLTNVSDPAGAQLVQHLLTEAAVLGASTTDVMNVMRSMLDGAQNMADGLYAATENVKRGHGRELT